MQYFLRFILLVVVLNVIRYVVGMPLEMLFVFDGLMGTMAGNPSYFNTNFTTSDWITSYFYNFMMWLSCVLIFDRMHPVISGSWMTKSLKIFSMTWLFFASVSAIYMNHYSHTKMFYFYNIIDSIIVFALVAIANSLLYPRLLRNKK
ncbi:hypothetical protein K1X84_08875 [bacterium]|nr:hypothetical protein [bacterium]